MLFGNVGVVICLSVFTLSGGVKCASLRNVSAVAPVRPGGNAVAEEVSVPQGEHLIPVACLIASGRARVGCAL